MQKCVAPQTWLPTGSFSILRSESHNIEAGLDYSGVQEGHDD